MRALFRLLVLCVLAAPASAGTVLVFGDSLSAGYGLSRGQGWVDLLARDLAPRHRVVNASVSGETTAGGLSRLPQVLARHTPDVVVLELGGNDGLRGLPVETMYANLEKMVALSRAAGAKVLLVGIGLPPNYGQPYVAKFRAAYDELARKHRLAYVPLLIQGFETNLAYFQADSIHPTAQAQPIMLRNVRAQLPLPVR